MEEDVTRQLRPRRPAEETHIPPPAPPPAPRVAAPQPATTPDMDDVTIRFNPEQEAVTGWLVITKGMGRGRSLPLGYGIHSVGRGEDQRVRISFGDKSISRRNHLTIAYDALGRCFYVTPGTGATLAHLNKQPVLQPCALHAWDRIGIGKTELIFVPFCGDKFEWQDE